MFEDVGVTSTPSGGMGEDKPPKQVLVEEDQDGIRKTLKNEENGAIKIKVNIKKDEEMEVEGGQSPTPTLVLVHGGGEHEHERMEETLSSPPRGEGQSSVVVEQMEAEASMTPIDAKEQESVDNQTQPIQESAMSPVISAETQRLEDLVFGRRSPTIDELNQMDASASISPESLRAIWECQYDSVWSKLDFGVGEYQSRQGNQSQDSGFGNNNSQQPMDCVNGTEGKENPETDQEQTPEPERNRDNGNGPFIFVTPQSIKKSSLRKTSKYAALSNASLSSLLLGGISTLTPKCRERDDNPTPRKRIRIVLDQDVPQENEEVLDIGVSYGESGDLEEHLTSTGRVAHTQYNNELMIWVSPPTYPVDFVLVNEDIVRASRHPIVTSKLSVEVDMSFIDGAALSALMECKNTAIRDGAFTFEKAALKTCPKNETDGFFYTENALVLKNLDSNLNSGLVYNTFPKEFNFEDDGPNSVYYFADIWSNSKGFREYILSKSLDCIQQGIVVRGFALRDCDGSRKKDFSYSSGILFNYCEYLDYPNDEELGKRSLPVELVEHLKTEEGESSLDICNIVVSDAFVDLIMAKTDGIGVHLLVADNPQLFRFPELVREVRFRRKLYAQCVIALLTVREGGIFIVKIHDVLTLFTAGLIFLMHRCFHYITIHKPKTSSSHSSERFLICLGKRGSETSDEIVRFLLACHNMVMKNEQVKRIIRKRLRKRIEIQTFEVKQLVPLKVIISHSDFFEFLRHQNMQMAGGLVFEIQQVLSPCGIQTPLDNHGISTANLQLESSSVEDHVTSMLTKFGVNLAALKIGKEHFATTAECNNLSQKSCGSWIAFPIPTSKGILASHPLTLFFGLGSDGVFYMNGSKLSRIHIDGFSLTKGTVLFGNIVELHPSEEQLNLTGTRVELQLFDAISLSGSYIGGMSYNERMKICKAYATAMSSNLSRNNNNNKQAGMERIAVSDPITLVQDEPVFQTWMETRVYTKNGLGLYEGHFQVFNHPSPDSAWVTPFGGFLLYKPTLTVIDSLKQCQIWKIQDTVEEADASFPTQQ